MYIFATTLLVLALGLAVALAVVAIQRPIGGTPALTSNETKGEEMWLFLLYRLSPNSTGFHRHLLIVIGLNTATSPGQLGQHQK